MSKYALISVSNKTAVEFLAANLITLGYEIISTGGTASYLEQNGVKTIQISDWTGFPEIMDGRIKTLHPKVHGGILALRNDPEHLKIMTEQGIKPIDIVVVNLYPFRQTMQSPQSTHAEIIENIDIGGPSMLRSAAKNYAFVTVLTDPVDYFPTLAQIKTKGNTEESFRQHLAAKTFAHCAEYDVLISSYFKKMDKYVDLAATNQDDPEQSPSQEPLLLGAPKIQNLRYGENPHQSGGFFSNDHAGLLVMHGKPLSFNNLLDVDAAIKGIKLYSKPTVMIFKHTNPCGIGSDNDITLAYDKALKTDTLSPFGGIVITNDIVTMELAEKINDVFTEIIIATGFIFGASSFLEKKKDRRLLSYDLQALQQHRPEQEVKSIIAGYLAQGWDDTIESEIGWKVVTKLQPTPEQYEALRFAWRAVSLLKSNAIALTTTDRTIGLGTGQTSRVDSTEIAIWKAEKFGHDISRSVCASDGFFPFRDSIDLLAKYGIKAVIQPGGSKGDTEVIAACDEHRMCMIHTGSRHFRH